MLRQVLEDHDCAKGPTCATCGYVPTRRQPVCRTVVLAKAVLYGSKPTWAGTEPAPAAAPSTDPEPDLFSLLAETEGTS